MSLTTIHTAAADYIRTHGWTQGQEEAPDGRVCLTGALRKCSPGPGDFYLVREVYRARGHAESWNDRDGMTATEVIAYLESHSVTDADLAALFGPQWEQIVALVRRAAVLTPEEAERLHAAWGAAQDAAQDAARDAAWDAAQEAAWGAAWGAAQDAARDAAWDAAWVAAWGAVWGAAQEAACDATREAAWVAARVAVWGAAQEAACDATREAAWVAAWVAACALVVRDLIGSHGFTQESYDVLTAPWRQVIGPVHPEDDCAGGAP